MIEITILALVLVFIFSVLFIQLLGGLTTIILNKGFTLKNIHFKGLCPKFIIPPLVISPQLGMLLGGIVSRNLLNEIIEDMDENWSLQIRNLALTVILLRAGIGLDLRQLKAYSSAVIRLTLLPQLAETLIIALIAYGIWDFPFSFAFATGFMLAAVSPAVVVPICIKFRNEGLGGDKGIPNIIIAASSLDDVVAISMFGILIGIGFGGEAGGPDFFDDPLITSILIGPIELLGGILVGILMGLLLSLLKKLPEWVKSICFVVTAYTLVFFCTFFHLAGLAFLGVITSGCVAGMNWGREKGKIVEDEIGYLWKVLIIFLFGLIGSSIYLADLEAETIGSAILIIGCGQVFRVPTAIFSMFGTDLVKKERIFVGIVWIAKATVQAALGGVVLGLAEENDMDNEFVDIGEKMLTVAVLCILITAPIGAVLTSLVGPRVLTKVALEESEEIPMSEQSEVNPEMQISNYQENLESNQN